jgi:hypothetical protein
MAHKLHMRAHVWLVNKEITMNKLVPALAAAGLLVCAQASIAGIMFTLDATSSTNGQSLSGFSTTDTLTVDLVANNELTAWRAWDSTTCTNPAGDATCRGWLTNFRVELGVGSGNFTTFTSMRFPTATGALNAFTPIELTGFESYGFKINDSNYGDNAGGLSFDVTVRQSAVPVPATLGLLALGFLALRKSATS